MDKKLFRGRLLLALGTALSLPAAADYKAGLDALAVRDYARARAEFEAEPNHPQALYQLSRMARLAWGEPRNDTRRAGLLQRAMDLGHAQAKHEYAVVLANGFGVTADPPRAIQLLEELDAAGHVESTVYLGQALRFGWWKLPKDEARSTALLRKASERGHDLGTAAYARALIDGLGVPADPPQGAALLKAAADRGGVDSQLEYARVLSFGPGGLPKDEAAGTALYRKVADATGDPGAQFAVGLAYLGGRGVPRDEAAAARWIDAAARQGSEWAQVRLADLFRTGTGVPRLRGYAYYWYSIAARSNGTASDNARERRATLAREMSEGEIENQMKRAAAFQPQPGFRPRETPLPPLARGDSVKVGPVSITIPAPRGFVNNWEFVETLHRISPNDRAMRPRLMVLSLQEDMDRVRMGLPSALRSLEVEAHIADENTTVTPALFADIRKEFRTVTERSVAEGRIRIETLRDDDTMFTLLRSSAVGDRNVAGIAVMLVNGRVLLVSFTGFELQQMDELRELVKTTTGEIVARNARGGFFGGAPATPQ